MRLTLRMLLDTMVQGETLTREQAEDIYRMSQLDVRDALIRAERKVISALVEARP